MTAAALQFTRILAMMALTFVGAQAGFYSGDCNDPHGNDCSWYGECLERSIPCRGREGDYAIAYGNKFCNLFNDNYDKFSSNGKKWIDAVRKCLQVKLAEKLGEHISCPDLKTYAFGTHVPCYVNPGPADPSFCDLGMHDLVEVMATIKSSLKPDFSDTMVAGLKTAAAIEVRCGTRYAHHWARRIQDAWDIAEWRIWDWAHKSG